MASTLPKNMDDYTDMENLIQDENQSTVGSSNLLLFSLTF